MRLAGGPFRAVLCGVREDFLQYLDPSHSVRVEMPLCDNYLFDSCLRAICYAYNK